MTERNPAENGAKPSVRLQQRILSSAAATGQAPCATPSSTSNPCPSSGVCSQDPSNFEKQFLRTLDKVYQTIEKNEFRLEEQDRKEAIKRDWQQVALVVDRVLLLIFMVATLSITTAILFHAPHSREFLFSGFYSVDRPDLENSSSSVDTTSTTDASKPPSLGIMEKPNS